MTQLQTIFYNSIIFTEIFSFLIGIIYFKKLKNTYWIWFVVYLTFISFAELFAKFGLENFPNYRKYYYNYFIIPLEFLFFFWLYSKKSLKNNYVFYSSIFIYLISLLALIFGYDEVRIIGSISYTVGNLCLAVMIFLEFFKQIKSDEILNFNKNIMFYVNFGVLLFYIGTLPLFTFDKFLFENDKNLWSNYFTFFLFSVNLMYLLFTAAFIWGKPQP